MSTEITSYMGFLKSLTPEQLAFYLQQKQADQAHTQAQYAPAVAAQRMQAHWEHYRKLVVGFQLVREGKAEIRCRPIGSGARGALHIYEFRKDSPSGVILWTTVGEDTEANRALVARATGKAVHMSNAAYR